jgi:hypothetical protein
MLSASRPGRIPGGLRGFAALRDLLREKVICNHDRVSLDIVLSNTSTKNLALRLVARRLHPPLFSVLRSRASKHEKQAA